MRKRKNLNVAVGDFRRLAKQSSVFYNPSVKTAFRHRLGLASVGASKHRLEVATAGPHPYTGEAWVG